MPRYFCVCVWGGGGDNGNDESRQFCLLKAHSTQIIVLPPAVTILELYTLPTVCASIHGFFVIGKKKDLRFPKKKKVKDYKPSEMRGPEF